MLSSILFSLIVGCSTQQPNKTETTNNTQASEKSEQAPAVAKTTPAKTEASQEEKTTPVPTAVAAPPKDNKSGVTKSLDSNVVVGKWKNGSIKYGELFAEMHDQLAQQQAEYLVERFTMEKNSLEGKIMEKILAEEAKNQGLPSQEELLKKEIDDKISEPTEAEILAFYEQVKGQIQGTPLEYVKDRIIQSLKQQQAQLLMQVYLDNLKKQYQLEINFPFPDVPRVKVATDDDPFVGAENPEITIVQFAEYQCPYCGMVNQEIDKVMAAYPNKVKMIFRDFPLSFHEDAVPAAIAANCAGEQDKYWDMYEILMANQSALKEAQLVSYASSLSLDMEKWNTCRQDPKQKEEVNTDLEDGMRAGVNGTPAFFVNGIKLSGGFQFEQFKEIIDRELQNK